jgi:hypothetical protein
VKRLACNVFTHVANVAAMQYCTSTWLAKFSFEVLMCTFYTEQRTGVLLVYKIIVATAALHVCAQFIISSSDRSSAEPA